MLAADRAVFGSLWGLAAIYQLFFVDQTGSEGNDWQEVFAAGWLVAVVLLVRALVRGTDTIVKWAFIAVLCGFGASVFDLGPLPDIGRREILLHFGLGVLTAAFAARWSPAPPAGEPPT